MTTTARQYVIYAGWDFHQVRATAEHGVSDEDEERLAEVGITPEELLDYCREELLDYCRAQASESK